MQKCFSAASSLSLRSFQLAQTISLVCLRQRAIPEGFAGGGVVQLALLQAESDLYLVCDEPSLAPVPPQPPPPANRLPPSPRTVEDPFSRVSTLIAVNRRTYYYTSTCRGLRNTYHIDWLYDACICWPKREIWHNPKNEILVKLAIS